MNEDIINSLRVLEQGGVILYPTDTIWGIGCDATNEKAVQRIYQIKKREDLKSMLVLIDNPDRLYQYVSQIPEIAWDILEAAVSPITIIYPGVKNLAANLIAGDRSAGIRITSDRFCQKLIHRFKKPVVSTSANISGKDAPQVFNEIDPVIKKSVDYIVNWRQDDLSCHKPSGIIKLGVNGEVEVIRE
ncbi:MAG: threonylcarbamoyl-AMP synthase [Bacteroidales bacterium]|nr:threonylcarbamoyl-AMP synthase [Bacteroidales bacterium]